DGRKARYRAIKVKNLNFNHHDSQPLRSLASAESMIDALREMFEEAEPLPDDADLFDVENRIALLRLMASAPADDHPVFLWIRGFPEGKVCRWADAMESYY